jgi:hypothetical protein
MAAAAAALVPVLPAVRDIAPNARVDILALALTLGGFLLCLGWRTSPWRAAAALVCLVAAFYTKQTMIAAPIACTLALAVRHRRAALTFAACGIALGLVAWVWLQAVTNGQFGQHIVTYTRNTFSLAQSAAMIAENVRHAWPLLILAALAAGRFVTRRSIRDDVTRAVAIYTVLAGIVTLTSGKTGAGPYYFVEWNLLCVALAAAFVADSVQQWRLNPAAWRPAAAGALVVVFAVGQSPVLANSALQLTSGARRLETSRRASFAAAVEVARATTGDVLACELLLVDRAGKPQLFEPSSMYELTRTGDWDPAPFLAQLRAGRYGSFLAESDLRTDDRVPAPIREVLVSLFTFEAAIGKYRVYRFTGPSEPVRQ